MCHMSRKITVTVGSSKHSSLSIFEYSGIVTSSLLDQIAKKSCGDDRSCATGTKSNNSIAHYIASATGTFESTEGWNQDKKAFGVIATFKGACPGNPTRLRPHATSLIRYPAPNAASRMQWR